MITTTVVGSYPTPAWLKASPSPEAMDDAIRVIIQEQISAGIELPSDGEVNRWNYFEHRPSGMVDRFAHRMNGVATHPSLVQRTQYESRPDVHYRGRPPGVVVGPLGSGCLDLPLESRRLAQLAPVPVKVTLTSPYMMAKLLHDEHYRDFSRLLIELANVLAEQVGLIEAEVIQIDEPNLPGSSHDATIAAEAINRIVNKARCKTAVHLCFGNFGGQRIQRGSYEQLVAFFNALKCDHLVLETTRRDWQEVLMLRDVKAELTFGFGVIDVKDLQVESAPLVAERIEKLVNTFGIDRVQFVNPDCGLSHLPRDVAERKLRVLTEGRNLFLGACEDR